MWILIISILIILWITNSFIQHSNGTRIAFAGMGFTYNKDGKLEPFTGIQNIIADSKSGLLHIGSQSYQVVYGKFENGTKDFFGIADNIHGKISKDTVTLKLSNGKMVIYSHDLDLAKRQNIV